MLPNKKWAKLTAALTAGALTTAAGVGAWALSCIDYNPEVAQLEIVSVEVEGQAVEELADWRESGLRIEAMPQRAAGVDRVRLVRHGEGGAWQADEEFHEQVQP